MESGPGTWDWVRRPVGSQPSGITWGDPAGSELDEEHPTQLGAKVGVLAVGREL